MAKKAMRGAKRAVRKARRKRSHHSMGHHGHHSMGHHSMRIRDGMSHRHSRRRMKASWLAAAARKQALQHKVMKDARWALSQRGGRQAVFHEAKKQQSAA